MRGTTQRRMGHPPMSVPERNGFAVALAAALRARDLGAVERVIRLFGGCKVYLPRAIAQARGADTVALARRLLAAGVGRAAVVSMVAQRRQISERHARRVVAGVLADTLGQTVAARCGRVESST